MITEKDYCDYETCVALIELGFVGASPMIYKEGHLEKAPRNLWLTPRVAKAHGWTLGIHLYNAQKWLREKRNILIFPERNCFGWNCRLHWFENNVERISYPCEDVSSYEEALSEGIKEAIKKLKEEN